MIPAMGYIEIKSRKDGMTVQELTDRVQHLMEYVKALKDHGDGKALYDTYQHTILFETSKEIIGHPGGKPGRDTGQAVGW